MSVTPISVGIRRNKRRTTNNRRRIRSLRPIRAVVYLLRYLRGGLWLGACLSHSLLLYFALSSRGEAPDRTRVANRVLITEEPRDGSSLSSGFSLRHSEIAYV